MEVYKCFMWMSERHCAFGLKMRGISLRIVLFYRFIYYLIYVYLCMPV